jgi:hypothetical protein
MHYRRICGLTIGSTVYPAVGPLGRSISQQDQPPMRHFASKSVSGAVRGEISTVRVAQAAERGHGLNGECSAGDFAQRGTDAWRAVIAEADQALVKGGIPQGREQMPVSGQRPPQ